MLPAVRRRADRRQLRGERASARGGLARQRRRRRSAPPALRRAAARSSDRPCRRARALGSCALLALAALGASCDTFCLRSSISALALGGVPLPPLAPLPRRRGPPSPRRVCGSVCCSRGAGRLPSVALRAVPGPGPRFAPGPRARAGPAAAPPRLFPPSLMGRTGRGRPPSGLPAPCLRPVSVNTPLSLRVAGPWAFSAVPAIGGPASPLLAAPCARPLRRAPPSVGAFGSKGETIHKKASAVKGSLSALRALDCRGLFVFDRDQVGGALRSAEVPANLNHGGAFCVPSRRRWFSLVRRLRSACRRSGSAPRSTAARRRNRVRCLPLRGRCPRGALCPFPGSRAPPVPRRLGRLWPLRWPHPQQGHGRSRPCPGCVLGRQLSRHGVHDRRSPVSRAAGGRAALLALP